MRKVSNIEEQWSVIGISKSSACQMISFDVGSHSFGKLRKNKSHLQPSRKMQAERQKQALEKIHKKMIDTEKKMAYVEKTPSSPYPLLKNS